MAKYDVLVSLYYGISFASKHSHHDMISFGLYREQIKRLHKVACLYGMNMDQAYAGSWEKKFRSELGKEVPGSGESYNILI